MGHQRKDFAKQLITERCGSKITYRKGKTSSVIEFVLIVMRVHLFPSRTQKLSSCTLTILGGRLPGKISNANTWPRLKSRGFFLPKTCHRHVLTAGRYVGLPGIISNANIKPPQKCGGSFFACKCPPDTCGRQDDTLACLVESGKRRQDLHSNVEVLLCRCTAGTYELPCLFGPAFLLIDLLFPFRPCILRLL